MWSCDIKICILYANPIGLSFFKYRFYYYSVIETDQETTAIEKIIILTDLKSRGEAIP